MCDGKNPSYQRLAKQSNSYFQLKIDFGLLSRRSQRRLIIESSNHQKLEKYDPVTL